MSGRGMERLGLTLERTLKRMGLARAVRERMALVVWGEVVGAAAARHTRPVIVRRGQMLVRVSSSTWAQELTLMRHQLVDRLNARLGEHVIRDIKFAVDPSLALATDPPTGRSAGTAPAPAHPDPQVGARWEREGQEMEMALGKGARDKWYRVRAAAARQREQMVRRGWRPCSLCGAWADPAPPPRQEACHLPFLCGTCRHGGAGERIREAVSVLYAAPWITEGELAGRVPGLGPGESRLARRLVADRIRQELYDQAVALLEKGAGADWSAWQARAQELVLVATGLPVYRIGETEKKRALGDLLPLWEGSAAGRR